MDLKTFVEQTLVAVVEGVKAAQMKYPTGSGTAAINHVDRAPAEAALPTGATPIEFDVAVTSASEEETGGSRKGGLNIRVVEASMGSTGAERTRSEAVSRVRFTVPVSLPVTHTSDLHEANMRRNAEATRQLRDIGQRLT